MKKIVLVITVFLILFSSITGVSADEGCKDFEVTLCGIPSVAKVGEIIPLTATALKHGSSYQDSWENAEKVSTSLDLSTERYVSNAVFTADKPGTYNISYTIKMTAGSSDVVFYQKVERTIEVINSTAVVGAVIKDLAVTPVYNAEGNISSYSASGMLHALWSDGTTTPNGSVHFFFAPDESSKDLNVTLYVDGQQYNYTITVNR